MKKRPKKLSISKIIFIINIIKIVKYSVI